MSESSSVSQNDDDNHPMIHLQLFDNLQKERKKDKKNLPEKAGFTKIWGLGFTILIFKVTKIECTYFSNIGYLSVI